MLFVFIMNKLFINKHYYIMKKLCIIVPKGSALDSYLADVGFIYDEIVHLSDVVCYKMNISLSLQFIDLFVSKFCLENFSIRCHDGEVTFVVWL